MAEQKQPVHTISTNAWELAYSLLSEWKKTVTVALFIMVMGWPAIVIKYWGEDLGVWSSITGRSQVTRHEEHAQQREILLEARKDRIELKESFRLLLTSLADHNKVALQRDGVILFFARDLCYSKYGKTADICETLADIPTTTHHKK